jgi:hypothetical protein
MLSTVAMPAKTSRSRRSETMMPTGLGKTDAGVSAIATALSERPSTIPRRSGSTTEDEPEPALDTEAGVAG